MVKAEKYSITEYDKMKRKQKIKRDIEKFMDRLNYKRTTFIKTINNTPFKVKGMYNSFIDIYDVNVKLKKLFNYIIVSFMLCYSAITINTKTLSIQNVISYIFVVFLAHSYGPKILQAIKSK